MDRGKRHWLAGASAILLLGGALCSRALSEPKNDFRFSILGDRTGSAQPQVYGRAWREIDLLHPDFVINVGDTIEGQQDATAQAQWGALRGIWQRYKHYPLYFTPGNHDVWSDYSRKLYEKESGRPAFYSFNYQEAHFTVLDNSRTLDLAPDQLEFLRRDLEANKSRRPKFVFFHKPYWIVFAKLKNSEFELHRIVKKYGVDYVITGHGHQFVRVPLEGVTYIEVGSSGGVMRGRGFEKGWFYHHVWARVKGSRVELTVKELDPPLGQGRMFRAEDWGDAGPNFDPADPAAKDKPET